MAISELAPRSEINEEEWQARIDLAALYRIFARLGKADRIYTHISSRIPGDEDHILINRHGEMFDEITASGLLKIDLDGNLPGDQTGMYNKAGFTIHSAIHSARPEIGCVVHLHTKASTAVAAQKQGLLPISQQALGFYDNLAYHDYEGIAFDLTEREPLAHDLVDKYARLLRNHGLFTCGRTYPFGSRGILTLSPLVTLPAMRYRRAHGGSR